MSGRSPEPVGLVSPLGVEITDGVSVGGEVGAGVGVTLGADVGVLAGLRVGVRVAVIVGVVRPGCVASWARGVGVLVGGVVTVSRAVGLDVAAGVRAGIVVACAAGVLKAGGASATAPSGVGVESASLLSGRFSVATTAISNRTVSGNDRLTHPGILRAGCSNLTFNNDFSPLTGKLYVATINTTCTTTGLAVQLVQSPS
jgi:hypothetical protein